MSATDPVEQISDALSRLRMRGRPAHAHERPRRGHADRGGRGAGGPALGRLLVTLAASGHSLSVSDIAEIIGVDQPRASRLVAQGVEFGFLRREADPADARRTRIQLTEQGAAVALRMRGQRGDAVRAALREFSDDEREQLASLLTRFVDAWPSPRP